jgi:hypothetical protein
MTREEGIVVAEWLSEEWLKDMVAAAGTRPPVEAANGTISVTITGGPAGEVAYHWSYRTGIPGDGGIGAMATADLILTIGHADARTVATGEVDPSVAYMRGRLKASGDGALLLGWLASTATDDYRQWRQRLAGGG